MEGERAKGELDDDDEDSAREKEQRREEMAVFPALYSASFHVEGDPPRSRGLITRFVGVVKCQR